jgi:2-methylcitrate dehydratase PrpD
MAVASDLVDDVARMAEGVDWGALPESTRAAAERCTLHVLATTHLGARRDIAQQVLRYALSASPGASVVVGHGPGSTATEAAFANATMCHADFRDDAHAPSQSHPGVTVIPAALAAAELRNGPLPAGVLGRAVVAGYQAIGRLGRLGATRSTPRGFRASSIYSVFGGAVAAAIVLGLEGDRLRAAISLAAQSAAGLNQPYLDGTDDWILLPGLAARNGLLAALLAREGVNAAERNLDGEIGFFNAYTDVADPGPFDALDLPDWEIEATRLKTVLTCGWNQAPMNTLLRSGVDLDDVDRLEVDVSHEAYEFPGVANYGPFTTYTAAVLSMPYAVGALLGTGRLESRSFDDVTDPVVEEAGHRIAIATKPELVGYDMDLRIILKDGSTRALHTPGGEPQWLLTWPEVLSGLETKYEAAGLDVAVLHGIARAVPAALAGADLGELLTALTASAGRD